MKMMPIALISIGYGIVAYYELSKAMGNKKQFSNSRIALLFFLWFPGAVNALFFLWIFLHLLAL